MDLDGSREASLFPLYSRLGEIVFETLGIKTDYEVDVSLLSPEQIREINRDYRKVDRVTDVISFAFLDDKGDLGKIADFEGERMLGEILICYEKAEEQAREIGQSTTRELCFLFVHGLLHLLGYDHMKKEDEEVMFPLQRKIMEAYEKEHGTL